MTKKFEVHREEFRLLPRDTRGLKEFVATVPDTAAYRLEERKDGMYLHMYWIDINKLDGEEKEEQKPVDIETYTIELPHICVYGKLAFEMITDVKAQDGIPFILDATDTIDLSRGFIDILFRKIKEYQAPYVIAKGWVREHMALLDEVSSKYHVVVRCYDNENLL